MRHLKEEELPQGIFDEMDLEKLGDYRLGHFNQRRLGTVEVVGIYLNTTAENQTPRAQYNEERTLNILFRQIVSSQVVNSSTRSHLVTYSCL